MSVLLYTKHLLLHLVDAIVMDFVVAVGQTVAGMYAQMYKMCGKWFSLPRSMLHNLIIQPNVIPANILQFTGFIPNDGRMYARYLAWNIYTL